MNWTVRSSVEVKGRKMLFTTHNSSVTVWIGKEVGRVTVVTIVIVGWLEERVDISGVHSIITGIWIIVVGGAASVATIVPYW